MPLYCFSTTSFIDSKRGKTKQAESVLSMELHSTYLICVWFLLPFLITAQTDKNITLHSSLRAGDLSSWVSPSKDFAFGFQEIEPRNFLLAIWFNNIPENTISWSANRDHLAPSGSLVEVTTDRSLILTNPSGQEIWRAKLGATSPTERLAYAAMLDTGNFVLATEASAVLWQSFDEPTDTLLPKQALKIGGQLIARFTEKNYSSGRFSFVLGNSGNLALYTTNFPLYNSLNSYYLTFETEWLVHHVVFNESGFMYLVARNGTILADVFSDETVSAQVRWQRVILEYDGVLRHYVYLKQSSQLSAGSSGWSIKSSIPNSCRLGDDNKPNCACPPAGCFPTSDASKGLVAEGRSSRTLVTSIVLPTVTVLTLLFLVTWVIVVWKRKQSATVTDVRSFYLKIQKDYSASAGAESVESCFEFSFNTIRAATNDFSQSNKLGQGGFGAVYKGRLPNGQLIAVKRLVRHSSRAEVEFKNEVRLVARLHHKNLTRLIGFCLGAKERILIYELVLNGSLDHILFDPIRREHLCWKSRYNIIQGIARGLLYLHEESQLRIIHRDLKASNVLLDESMNPKISDFGTARLFLEDQDSASKIVGTYGYMAPEYAKYGKISVRTDVFSFGILLLEIISGRRNSTPKNSKQIDHLLSQAWKCWTTGELLELIDPILLKENNQTDEIMRCIHLGLLGVQENASCRPTMNEVVLMLEGCSQILPSPLEPAYLMNTGYDEPNVLVMEDHFVGFTSVNQVSFTHPEPR